MSILSFSKEIVPCLVQHGAVAGLHDVVPGKFQRQGLLEWIFEGRLAVFGVAPGGRTFLYSAAEGAL